MTSANRLDSEGRDVAERATERLAGQRIPAHLAVIPDGNRRWASEQGLTALEGHRAGFEVAKRLSRFCRRIGIHTVTIWAFSTENWRRAPQEVAALMALYEEWLRDLLPEAIEEEVRVVHLGRKEGVPEVARADAVAAGFPDGLPASLRRAIEEIEAKTSSFERNTINLAINYGGVDEIVRALDQLLARGLAAGGSAGLDLEDFLDTGGQRHPNPDIVWRTSGEFRLSGFLPMQSVYAELVFTPKYFPALAEDDVVDAVLEFNSRSRRFGG